MLLYTFGGVAGIMVFLNLRYWVSVTSSRADLEDDY
jgi:hypothetical protein